MEETELELSFSQLVHKQLSLLLKEFRRYFLTTRPSNFERMDPQPFVNKPVESTLEEGLLLEIANDTELSMFQTTTLLVFWIKIKEEYPEIAKKSTEDLASISHILSL